MSEAVTRLRKATIERALNGDGVTSKADRKAAFEQKDLPEGARKLLEKVAKHAWKVTNDDVDAAKKSGLSDDAIFELVICAALGQATRQLDSALAAVEKA